MTQKDKIAYSKIYSKFNAGVERYAYTFFVKTLRKYNAILKPIIDQYPLEYLLANLDSIITTKVFQDAFNEVYPKIGNTFLKFHAKEFSIKKDKDPLKTTVEGINIAFRDAEKIAELAKLSTLPEVADKVTKITNYTKQIIRDTIEQGIALNKPKRDIARMIYDKTGGTIAKNRALVIARTETTYINSKAAEINIQDSPFKMEKTWIPVRDMRTREDHIAMFSHKAVPKEGYFNVGGSQMKYPGDYNGGAAQVVNCRCAIVYTPIKEDVEQQNELPQSGSLLSTAFISQLLNELFGQNN